MKKKKKVVKSVNKGPRTLTIREVLDTESRLHKISLLQKDTELLKAKMTNSELKAQVLQLQAQVEVLKLKDQQAELKDHGGKVMAAEKSSTEFIDELKQKYGVDGQLAYDPETFEIEEILNG